MLADNRLAEIADWDDRLLAQQLKELSLLVLISTSRTPASRSARSICGSRRSMTRRRGQTTRQIWCPNRRPVRRSARLAIYGCSAAIACCAAAPSIRRHSRR
jgi:hypothetical protein